jgi:hypothetical protein
MLYGVKIYKNEAALSDILIPYSTVNKYLSYDDNYLFCLEGNDETYYIAASFFVVFENKLQFNESSLYFDPGGEIASSLK